MTELFLVVGVLAVISAVFMLLSDNAVHSALFLVITMVGIAFMFLLLNAPFLAMIQITVYAGAIMVLFLFVIMLLGAERADVSSLIGSDNRKFRWYIPVVAVAIGSIFFIFALSILNSGVATRQIPADPPQARFLHAAADVGAVEVYAGETLLAADVTFGTATDFVALPEGATSVRIVADAAEYVVDVNLEADTSSTLIAYGAGTPQVSVIPTDRSTVTDQRSGRYVVFNGYADLEAVRVIDIGTEFDENDNNTLVESLPFGEYSAPLLVEEETANWTIVDANEPDDLVTRLEAFELERDTASLIAVVPLPVADGTVRPGTVVVKVEAAPDFGGPRAIGYKLFTTFLLPFQLLALLLLAAMVGAIVLTHRETSKARERAGGRRRVSRPLAQVIAAQVGQDITPDAPQLPGGEGSRAAGD
ncbi:MAG: NADH-quinone oxidoreductase subunit J [bacterium]|nr:NADH-quinone oxidoreductase subunit J [bacterium]